MRWSTNCSLGVGRGYFLPWEGLVGEHKGSSQEVSRRTDTSQVPSSLVPTCMVVDLFFHDPHRLLPWSRSIRLKF